MKTMKRNGKIEGIYFNWLYDQIKERGTSELENFIFELHCISFICLIPNDDNRVEDGIALRSKFEDELDYDIPEVPLAGLPCTVLEMLIALADKLDFILFDHKKGSQFKLWFWLLIDNLKLQKYTNDEDATQKKNLATMSANLGQNVQATNYNVVPNATPQNQGGLSNTQAQGIQDIYKQNQAKGMSPLQEKV